MELPPYRIPTAKATFTSYVGKKAEQYLKKMGGLDIGRIYYHLVFKLLPENLFQILYLKLL